jgi:transcription-repair coupling factor (superfamily II helicase)
LENGVELIKQLKQEVTILLNEEATNTIDGSKLFHIGSKYGRSVTPGMEGRKLKIVIRVKDYSTAEWLQIVFDMIKGIPLAKREQVNPVK